MPRRLMPDWWYEDMTVQDRRDAVIGLAAFLMMLLLTMVVGGPDVLDDLVELR